MKVTVLQQLTISDRIITPGEIIEIPDSVYPKLAGKVRIVTDGRDLPHYCRPSGSWCSEKLPQKNYLAGCIAINCEHHQERPCQTK